MVPEGIDSEDFMKHLASDLAYQWLPLLWFDRFWSKSIGPVSGKVSGVD